MDNEIPPKRDTSSVLLVLNDGETYCHIGGCSIMVVSSSDMIKIESGIRRIKDILPLHKINLKDSYYP